MSTPPQFRMGTDLYDRPAELFKFSHHCAHINEECGKDLGKNTPPSINFLHEAMQVPKDDYWSVLVGVVSQCLRDGGCSRSRTDEKLRVLSPCMERLHTTHGRPHEGGVGNNEARRSGRLVPNHLWPALRRLSHDGQFLGARRIPYVTMRLKATQKSKPSIRFPHINVGNGRILFRTAQSTRIQKHNEQVVPTSCRHCRATGRSLFPMIHSTFLNRSALPERFFAWPTSGTLALPSAPLRIATLIETHQEASR